MSEDQVNQKELATAVAMAEAKIKIEQLRSEIDELWKWKKENEALLLWSRNFMDTYRRTVGTVVASGAITLIGLLIQLYYMLSKSK